MKRYYCDVCGSEYKLEATGGPVTLAYIIKQPTASLFSGLSQDRSDICRECSTRLKNSLRSELKKMQETLK